MPAAVCHRLLRQAQDYHAAGLKAFVYFSAIQKRLGTRSKHWTTSCSTHTATVGTIPRTAPHSTLKGATSEIRRRGLRGGSTDLLNAWRRIEESGSEVVAPFHIHRRQPGNFSTIDYGCIIRVPPGT